MWQRYALSSLLLFSFSCASKSGFYHRVVKGETMYRIAKAYQLPVNDLARANNIRQLGAIREGQYLLIPYDDELQKKPLPADMKRQQRALTQLKRRTEVPKKLKDENLLGRFIWPVSLSKYQKVAVKFGNHSSQRHSGIDIILPSTTGIRAIAAGKVVYAGAKVQGFGPTVIIAHPEEIFSIYSFLDQISVRVGQTVKQGQEIGHSGIPQENHFGGVRPLLHFEIRERTVPLDPENILP